MGKLHPLIVLGGVLAGVLVVARRTAAGADMGKVQRMAEAIAFAEGFYSGGNPIPKRNHNPGDLKASSVPSVGKDASGHLIFASDADGWEALRRQLLAIVSGQSAHYTLDTTIRQMAAKYAEWSGNWSRNVAARLGVSEDTALRVVLT